MKEQYINLNGILTPYSEAKLHVSSVAVKYGASVFEGIRGYWNNEQDQLYLFSLHSHIERLFESMKLMKMKHNYSPEEIIVQIEETIKRNDIKEDCYVRVAASIEENGPIDSQGPVLINIAAFPLGRKPKQDGIKVSISSWTRISDNMMPPRIKCVANYQNGRLALIQAKEDGYDNTILLNKNGKISEAPTATVFFVKNGIMYTPSRTCGILESITREFLINVALKKGIKIVEREVDRSECYVSDEAFLCGTGAEIIPIISIDKHIIGDGRQGRLTTELRDIYIKTVYGQFNENRKYLYPIYE